MLIQRNIHDVSYQAGSSGKRRMNVHLAGKPREMGGRHVGLKNLDRGNWNP